MAAGIPRGLVVAEAADYPTAQVKSMNEEQRAAFLNSQVASALIVAAGMTADNARAVYARDKLPYTGKQFEALIDNYGIGHNAALTTLHGG